MKTPLILPLFLASGLALFCSNAAAHNGGGEGENGDGQHEDGENGDGQDENCQGGHIDGSETLVATVALVATTNAPADASGVANLISDNEDGVVTSSFSLTITGLTAGVYDLSVVKKSDGASVDLGHFAIGHSCHEGDGEDSDNNDDSEGDHGDHQWAVFLDASEVELPSDLDPMDIAQIVISDANGNAVLIGDLVNPTATTKIKFKAVLRASGSAASSTSGKARARSIVRKGKRSDQFTMLASGVAKNSTFTVTVNGQNAGTVKSNRKGKALLKKLSTNLLMVRSVHLVDANGQTALRTKF